MPIASSRDMRNQLENRERCRLVAVRPDGTKVVLLSNLSQQQAESIRADLVDPRAFAEIRIEAAKGQTRTQTIEEWIRCRDRRKAPEREGPF